MHIAIGIAIGYLVGFAIGMIFKSNLVAKEQAAAATLKTNAIKLVNKI